MSNALLGFNAFLPRRRVFVSYHHENDQIYYNLFSNMFASQYDVIQDNSLDRFFDSDDADYVMRRIREKHIQGTSCTFVLCGAETYQRKYVDWEIKASLDNENGLIGIQLPGAPQVQGGVRVPDRYLQNWQAGYAVWIGWEDLEQGATFLQNQIEVAISRKKTLINNSLALKSRNGE